MKCSVVGCSSDYMKNPLKKTFFGFPTDPAVAHKWVLFCQQPKEFNYRGKFICRDHFKDDDFLNIAQFKMGFALRLKIKRDAVPTIRRISTGPTMRELRIQRRNQKQIVNDLLRKYNQEQKVKIKLADSEFDEVSSTQSAKGSAPVTNNTNDKEDTGEQIELIANGYDDSQATKGLGLVTDNTNDKEDSVEQIDFIANVFDEICSTRATNALRPVHKLSGFAICNDKEDTISEDYIHNKIQFEEVKVGNKRDSPVNVFEEVDELREQIKLLRKDNICQRRINRGLCKKLEKWKRLNIEKDIRCANRISRVNVLLKNKTQECKNLEEKLNSIFTSGQINKMKSLKLNYQWDEEDIAKSLILYRSSGKTYKLLYDNGFPLPSVRTIQRWVLSHKIDPNKNGNDAKNLTGTKRVIDIVERENTIDTLNIIDPESINETGNLIETESFIETKKLIETESLIETENVIETENLIENENLIETGKLIETESFIEIENIIESESVIAPENIIDPENVILETHMNDLDQTFAEYAITIEIV